MHSGPRGVGRRTMDSGPRTMDNGPRPMDNGPRGVVQRAECASTRPMTAVTQVLYKTRVTLPSTDATNTYYRHWLVYLTNSMEQLKWPWHCG